MNSTRPAIIVKTIGRRYELPKLNPPRFEVAPQPPVKHGTLGNILKGMQDGK